MGSCPSQAICSFSGTLTVDATTATVNAIDVTFPGLAAFDTLIQSEPIQAGAFLWSVRAGNSTFDQVMTLEFLTQTPASLVGYTGGGIVGCCVSGELERFYVIFPTGSITAPTAATPEPSSLALMLSGVGLVFAMRKRQGLSQAI